MVKEIPSALEFTRPRLRAYNERVERRRAYIDCKQTTLTRLQQQVDAFAPTRASRAPTRPQRIYALDPLQTSSTSPRESVRFEVIRIAYSNKWIAYAPTASE